MSRRSSARARSEWKSGKSIRIAASGRRSRPPSRRRRRAGRREGIFSTTSEIPTTESDPEETKRSRPAAARRVPPRPNALSAGRFRRRASSSRAPWASPEASPVEISKFKQVTVYCCLSALPPSATSEAATTAPFPGSKSQSGGRVLTPSALVARLKVCRLSALACEITGFLPMAAQTTGKLRTAIVGCGRIAQRHAAILRDLEDVQLVAMVDTRRERAEQFAREYGGQAYAAFGEMVSREKPDLVNVCTPSGDHVGTTLALLRAGVPNVIVEKPMALRLRDADLMIEAADQARARLFVVKQNRYNLPIVKLR